MSPIFCCNSRCHENLLISEASNDLPSSINNILAPKKCLLRRQSRLAAFWANFDAKKNHWNHPLLQFKFFSNASPSYSWASFRHVGSKISSDSIFWEVFREELLTLSSIFLKTTGTTTKRTSKEKEKRINIKSAKSKWPSRNNEKKKNRERLR